MPRKTTILIAILTILTGILILIAVKSDNSSSNKPQSTISPTPTIVESYATLSFSKDILDISKLSSTQSVDIIIDTNGQNVSTAQIELSYDPQIITNVKFTPSKEPFFGEKAFAPINTIDQKQGRASYGIGISPEDQEKSGKGSVVTLTFTANKSKGVSSTSISFVTKSAVNTLSTQSSVLKSTTPLEIILTTPTITQ